MKKKSMVSIVGLGLLVLALVFTVAGCDNGGGGGGGTPFDGSTLVGTTWKWTDTIDLAEEKPDMGMEGLGVTMTMTAKFTSETAGTMTTTVTYTGTWPDGVKDMLEEFLPEPGEDSFTYNYDATEHTGTITSDGETSNFTVDVSAKTLTVPEAMDGEDMIYNLQ
jgi:hypothetical protein